MMTINFRHKIKAQLGRFKLRTKFILVFLFVSLSSVTAVALTVNYTTSKLLAEVVGTDLQNLASSEGIAVGDLLSQQVELLQSLSLNEILIDRSTLSNSLYREDESVILENFSARDEEWPSLVETDRLAQIILTNSVADELNSFQARFPEHVEIFITDQKGALLAATGLTSDYYQADETWWQSAYQDGQGAIYIGLPEYDDSSKMLGLVLAVPIYEKDGESVAGILRSTYDLTTLGEILEAAAIVEEALYLDIFLPDNKTLPTAYFLDPESVFSESPIVLEPTIIEDLQVKTFDQIMIDDVSNMVSLAPITTIDADPLISDLDWYIFARQNQGEALALVASQQRTILFIAILIMGLSVIGAVISAHFLTKPIVSLTAVAQQIREGNLEIQAQVESHDEIGNLAEAFNSMTIRLRHVITQLEEHRDQLENRVAERTTEIKRQKAMLDVILSTTPNYFFIFDQQGHYRYASPPALAQMDKEAEDLIGKPWQENSILIPQNFQEELDKSFKTKRTVANEFSITDRENKPDVQYFDYTLDPVLDSDGQVDSVVATIRDVTTQKAEQEAMWHTQKIESLGILAGGVAHDFNNLLVAMLSQTSLALLKMSPSSPARQHVDKAKQASERAAELTRQMLDYSGRGTFELQPIQLNQLIQENVHLFNAVIPKNIHLQIELVHSLPLFLGDPGQIQQIVMNLILNAAESICKKSGEVIVATDIKKITEGDEPYSLLTNQPLPTGQYILLSVKDNGIGMDNETVSKIFDPFFTTKFTGRGLGLAATLGIVRGHQGGVHVTSQLNTGTLFEIIFPISKTDILDQPDHMELEMVPQAVYTVLVIDDEKPVREAIVDILTMQAIHVLTANDGETGIGLYRQNVHVIDLIILDLSMPGLSGHQTFKQLKQINTDAKIILSSGYSASEVSRQFKDEDVTDFLSKPYKLATLIQTVEQHLQP